MNKININYISNIIYRENYRYKIEVMFGKILWSIHTSDCEDDYTATDRVNRNRKREGDSVPVSVICISVLIPSTEKFYCDLTIVHAIVHRTMHI